jgi:hypothetical protein
MRVDTDHMLGLLQHRDQIALVAGCAGWYRAPTDERDAGNVPVVAAVARRHGPVRRNNGKSVRVGDGLDLGVGELPRAVAAAPMEVEHDRNAGTGRVALRYIEQKRAALTLVGEPNGAKPGRRAQPTA